ncbi:MAG: 1-acyl-sn-glycerol-3-phosphate acyltransferase [Armatimonadetes bacterium]|nr:1-acyl-sn-glycerol-3-phosphate acyltransferase [Armatimonadota bacterium]
MKATDAVSAKMIEVTVRRSVASRFHGVYWQPPKEEIQRPAIFVPNHHGWFDGYIMYLALHQLGIPTVSWIQEFEAFPIFVRAGGLPFPLESASQRAATIRKTVRLMLTERCSLLLFAEGVVHYPPDLLPFNGALEFMANRIPGVQVIPVGIHYELAPHERPEAFVTFGSPLEPGEDIAEQTRTAVGALLKKTRRTVRESFSDFEHLVEGTPDGNEKQNLRRHFRWRH